MLRQNGEEESRLLDLSLASLDLVLSISLFFHTAGSPESLDSLRSLESLSAENSLINVVRRRLLN